MRNSVGHKSSDWCRTLLLLILCAGQLTEAEDGYTIPADAIRIGAEELTADHLTEHLAGLIGNNRSSLFEQEELEELEEQVEADDHHLPTALARLNALLQAAEERKERFESNAATSRLLSINRGGFFRGLLIVWVPVSFLLPTLARRPTHYRGRSGRFRNRNTIDNHVEENVLADREPISGYNPQSPDYKFESHYGPLLSRLEAYFSLMKIDQLECRWKLLCHASQQPDVYQPLSSLFRRLFERSSKPINQQSYHPALKKFFTYVWADKKGARFKSAKQCDLEYASCSSPVHHLIRMDMIRFWQKLSKRFAIQLQDE